jgi:uncharacterized protein YuzE
MRIRYDPVADAAFIDLKTPIGPGDVPDSHVCDVNFKEAAIILGFGRDGRLIQLEILGASKVLPLELLKGDQSSDPRAQAPTSSPTQ